jgi:hypothetical protein
MPAAKPAAAPPLEPPGTQRKSHGLSVGPKQELSVVPPHCELVHVRLADQDRIRLFQPRDNGGIIRGREMLQHPRTARCRLAARAKVVLDRNGQSGQRSQRTAGTAALVDLGSAGQCGLDIHTHKGVNGRVMRSDLLQELARQRLGRNLARFQFSQQLDGGTRA